MSKSKPPTTKARRSLSSRTALLHLRKADPVLYAAALPYFPELLENKGHRRSYRELFESLAGTIVSQQLSTKAADTIWGRLKKACHGTVTPETLLTIRLSTMRKAGLSAAKAKTLKELSRAVTTGTLTIEALRLVPEEEAVNSLSAVWGIGRWTAEMFLMFALGREDIFSSNDLGLMRAMEQVYGISKNSPKKVYVTISEKWRPYRSLASRALWKIRDTPLPPPPS